MSLPRLERACLARRSCQLAHVLHYDNLSGSTERAREFELMIVNVFVITCPARCNDRDLSCLYRVNDGSRTRVENKQVGTPDVSCKRFHAQKVHRSARGAREDIAAELHRDRLGQFWRQLGNRIQQTRKGLRGIAHRNKSTHISGPPSRPLGKYRRKDSH